ncbi:lipoyl domain-containing protein [Enterovibrio makurazakiensis]|uniref:biotin/lipoyl-containing protein n=1 Tax=Enterovibrio makurazakiensis TaxID=2910232 RepID=UPI003D1C4A9F
MNTEIIIAADLWEEEEEGVMTTWFVSNGANVEKDDVIAEVMVQKIQHEIHSPSSGVLEILKWADETVSKGDKIGLISGV